jgi:nickel transport protein
MKTLGHKLFLTLATLIAALGYCQMAQAHAVYLFAWPQGDQIFVRSYFSKKSPVRQGTVTILDSAGQVLDTAKTDDKGEVSFNRPQTTSDLTFVVEAGEGHRADFLLRAVDLPPLDLSSPGEAGEGPGTEANLGAANQPVIDQAATPSDPNSTAEAKASASPAVTAGVASTPAVLNISLNELRAMFREELGSQLGPINRALAEAEDDTPTLKDIIGGLGWLVGIFGLAFWYSGRESRRKKN